MAPNYMTFQTDWTRIKKSAAGFGVDVKDKCADSCAAYKRKDYAAALLIQTAAIGLLQDAAKNRSLAAA